MKLKLWVKVLLLILVETFTVSLIFSLDSILFGMKVLIISTFLCCENLIMFIGGE